MVRIVLLASLALLASCSDPAKDAEERFNITLSSGDKVARCRAAEEVAAVHLKQKHEAEFQEWSERAKVFCSLAANSNA
jgi:hypothetical protein